VAFRGGYHGLSYAPLAVGSFRDGYRAPFAAQLNPEVYLVDYPSTTSDAARSLAETRGFLRRGDVGAVIVEPILGRGGCVVPPSSFFAELASLCRDHGALVIADEIWTGLGRSGHWLYSAQGCACADLICLGKGLGGGLPISACVGRADVMGHWAQDEEVVHTSTYAGAPLACAAALATLSALRDDRLIERSAQVGRRWRDLIAASVLGRHGVEDVRGSGLMVAVDLGPRPGVAIRVQRELLTRGYVVSTGGGQREVLILTPPLNTALELLEGMVAPLVASLHALAL
jgi:4-aminobutyrate aminotransferase/(S)-3-amino-2-methylpropionate transaminase